MVDNATGMPDSLLTGALELDAAGDVLAGVGRGVLRSGGLNIRDLNLGAILAVLPELGGVEVVTDGEVVDAV